MKGKWLSVARPVFIHRYNTCCAVTFQSKMSSFPFTVYWFSSSLRHGELYVFVSQFPRGSPGTFSVYGFTVITFSPLNHRRLCVVVPPFPCPLTGHTLSVGYTTSSHTKGPLKYQFVYSSGLNVQCAV